MGRCINLLHQYYYHSAAGQGDTVEGPYKLSVVDVSVTKSGTDAERGYLVSLVQSVSLKVVLTLRGVSCLSG